MSEQQEILVRLDDVLETIDWYLKYQTLKGYFHAPACRKSLAELKPAKPFSGRLEKLPDNVSFVKNGGWTGRRAPRWSEKWIQVDGENFETVLAKLEAEIRFRAQEEENPPT